MPPAKKPTWERRSKWQSVEQPDSSADDVTDASSAVMAAPSSNLQITAAERLQLYARLLWLGEFKLLFAAEAAMDAPLLQALTAAYT